MLEYDGIISGWADVTSEGIMKLCLTSSAPMKNASARDFFQASKVAAGDGGGSQSDHCLVFSTITAQEHLLEEQQCFFHLAR